MLDFQQFWRIYQEAFPTEERRTLKAQQQLMEKKNYHVKPHYQGSEMVGFIAYWNFEDFLFIEHMAVNQPQRGKGYGRKIMTDTINKFDGNIILEVEYPEDEISRKRIKFYQDLGFKLNQLEYLQPSYGEGKKPVPLLLMSYPRLIEASKVMGIIDRIHRGVYAVGEIVIE